MGWLNNLNSKKLVVSIFIVAGLTVAMVLEKITGLVFAEKMMIVFTVYMALELADKKSKNGV